MKRQRNTTKMKEQTRNTEVQINEEERGKLPEKEFRKMIVKMIKNFESKMEKMQESINKDLEELTEKAMATHSNTLAWNIPWTEKPVRLQSMGSWRVGHDWSDLAAAAEELKNKHAETKNTFTEIKNTLILFHQRSNKIKTTITEN